MIANIHHRIQTMLLEDAPLNESERYIVEQHLTTCADCRIHAELVKRMEAGLWSPYRKISLSPGEKVQIAHTFQFHPRRQPMRYTNFFSLLGWASFILILVIALGWALNILLPTSPLSVVKTSPVPISQPSILTDTLIPQDMTELPPEWLAFTSIYDGNCNIYLAKTDGSELIDISNNTDCDWNPVWSPDGQKLAFISSRGDSSQIYTVDVNSMELSQLTESSQLTSVSFCSKLVDINLDQMEGFLGLSWSPDGEFLVASLALNLDGNMFEPLFLMAADGSGIIQLTEGNDIYPQWSPDGEKIGFIRLADCDGGGHDIYVINRDGSGLTNLTAGPASESSTFTWSPDGQRIAYFSTTLTDNNQSYTNIEMVNADSTNRVTLLEMDTGENHRGGEITWSPDGKQLAYVNPHQSNDGQIYLLDIESQETKLITTISDHYFNLSWSPDGQWLLFAAGIDVTKLIVLDVRSALESPEEALIIQIPKPNSGSISGPQWRPSPDQSPTSTPVEGNATDFAFEPGYQNRTDSVLVDLNCDGQNEQLLTAYRIPTNTQDDGSEVRDYLGVTLQVPDDGGIYRSAWTYTFDHSSRDSLYRVELFPVDGCEQLIIVDGQRWMGNVGAHSLQFFRWYGNEMVIIFEAAEGLLYTSESEAPDAEDFSITTFTYGFPDPIRHTCDWTYRQYTWDGETFILVDEWQQHNQPCGGAGG